MKRLLVAAALLAATAWACGGTVSVAPFAVEIPSSRSLDGDITMDNGVLGAPVPATVSGNVQSGFAPGAPPAVPEAETRAFLVFGLAGIPPGAPVGFASVTLFVSGIDDLGLGGREFPFFLDLLDTRAGGTPPPLVSGDFDAPLLGDRSYRGFDFLPADAGRFVEIEVTSLMQQAQATLQPFFEVRLTPAAAEKGVVTIDDGPRADRAPRLYVEYY